MDALITQNNTITAKPIAFSLIGFWGFDLLLPKSDFF